MSVVVLVLGCEGVVPSRVDVPADSAAGETRFELARPNESAILVPVFIDGRGPYQLILDTGATFTCVDRTLAAELGLKERIGQIGYGAGIGQSGRVRLVGIDSLRVGAAAVRNVTACVLDLSALRRLGNGARGLLGLNFLRAFRVTIDFRRDVLRLESKDAGVPRDSAARRRTGARP